MVDTARTTFTVTSAALHGDLKVHLKRAVKLYNAETLGMSVIGKVVAKVARLKIDPYVNIKLGGVKLGTSATIEETLDPTFDEFFDFKLCHPYGPGVNDVLLLEVKDKNPAGSAMVGVLELPLADVFAAPNYTMDPPHGFPLQHPKKGQRGHLYASVSYMPHNPQAPATLQPVVPNVYFDAQPGNHVRLYQGAHNSAHTVPEYLMPTTGRPFRVHACWDDMYAALEAAERFIFITGWSVHPETKLVRNQPDIKGIGELCKQASERGVAVKIMVWDDRSSVSVPLLKNVLTGVMGTFDEELRTWFSQNAPAVQCALVPREGDEHQSVFEGVTAAACFSHHQKSVMCDTLGADGVSREVTAFIGGLDITKGRYDTALHPVLPGNQGAFQDDIYQGSFDTKDGQRPRQPWQDIHCQIRGPAAQHVVDNFTERWAKQVSKNVTTPTQLGCVVPPPSTDSEAFTVQMLRSIDSRSAAMNTSRMDRLFNKKGRSVDRSIYLGYIHHIRRARHFIYIENQYFLGSCYMWPESTNVGCHHAVCAELVQKIIQKIRAGERFAAYIVQPMFPEGDPYADSVAAILRFQQLTMQSMFNAVQSELNRMRSAAKATDYLNFFCLGNREAGPQPAVKNEKDKGALSERNRRFMIYVHSKCMIVDDEVALIGSANVNMRSLAGTRDSEIACALWQPAHMVDPRNPAAIPAGQVHGFRMSLWREHLRNATDNADIALLMEPSTVETVHRVQQLAEENWAEFMAEQNVNMRGHLMPYPVELHFDGQIILTPRVPEIPDFPGTSLGGKSTNLPNVLTT